MYGTIGLFEKRSVFASKLERYMEEHDLTKAKLCKEAGISRPTLDKILNVEIANAASFEKHAGKILGALQMTPDEFMGSVHNAYNMFRQIKNTLRISTDSVASETGISTARLKDIEAGGQATVAELRDIALCCETSVRGLLGTYYFEIPLAVYSYLSYDPSEDAVGFWGHIGVLMSRGKEYRWYPVSLSAKKRFYRTMDNQFMVVPCMNNKVLFLNMDHIDSVLLLDESCDQPSFTNWDPSVDNGETPLVIYEALEDCLYGSEDSPADKDRISPNLYKLVREFIEKNGWTDEDVEQVLNGVTVYFRDANVASFIGHWDEEETFTGAVREAYEFEGSSMDERRVVLTDDNGTEIVVNLDNVCMIEAPLLAVENAICRTDEDLIGEDDEE